MGKLRGDLLMEIIVGTQKMGVRTPWTPLWIHGPPGSPFWIHGPLDPFWIRPWMSGMNTSTAVYLTSAAVVQTGAHRANWTVGPSQNHPHWCYGHRCTWIWRFGRLWRQWQDISLYASRLQYDLGLVLANLWVKIGHNVGENRATLWVKIGPQCGWKLATMWVKIGHNVGENWPQCGWKLGQIVGENRAIMRARNRPQ